MITETAGLAAKTALRNGAAPAWILKIPFASGTVYLSDRVFTITNWATPAIVTLPWIASWGKIVENLAGVMAMPMVSGFSVDVIIDPKAATSIRTMIRSAPVEKLRCTLYRWDEDLDTATDPPVPRWVGNIVDHEQRNELLYHLDLVDESVILDKPIGRVLSLADYPLCDLNQVGRQLPILYGSVEGSPAIGLDVGAKTSLPSDLAGYPDGIAGTGVNLRIGSNVAYVAHDAFSYVINGVLYSKAANAVGVAPGNDVLQIWAYGAVAFDIGSDGTIDAIEAANQETANYATEAAAIAALPAVAAGHLRMGYVTVLGWGSVFTLGTSALNRQYSSVAYYSTAPVTAPVDFYVSNERSLTSGSVLVIEEEEILIATITGNHVTACTRGYNSTTAVAHKAGALVQQKKLACVYMFADHRVHSIGNIYANTTDGVSVDITARCTKYTGQPGCELAGYEGKAVVTVPSILSTEVYTCTDLPKTLSETVLSATGIFATPAAGSYTEKYFLIHFTANVSANPTTAATVDMNDTGYIRQVKSGAGAPSYSGNYSIPQHPSPGSPTKALTITWTADYAVPTDADTYWEFTLSGAGCANKVWQFIPLGLMNTPGASPIVTTFTGDPSTLVLSCTHTGGSSARFDLKIWCKWEWAGTGASTFKINVDGDISIGTVDETGWHPAITSPHKVVEAGAWNTGNIAITYGGGNLIGGTSLLTIDKVEMCQVKETAAELTEAGVPTSMNGEGWQDDGSGTITGTPDALIERPDHIYPHLFYTYRGWPLADFITDAASAFAADGYKFSLPILERKRLKEICAALAFQCRCWFRFSGGKARLTYRPDTLTSAMIVRAGMTAMNADYTTTRTVRPSPLDEVINVIHLYYKRDWTLPAGRSAYQAVLRDTHADSIAAYGEKEKPDLFLFDYVRDDAMAADLLAFYLAQYPFRTDVVKQEVSMRCSALEFGDAVTLAELDSLVGQVMEVGIAPGSKDTLDMISLIVRGVQP